MLTLQLVERRGNRDAVAKVAAGPDKGLVVFVPPQALILAEVGETFGVPESRVVRSRSGKAATLMLPRQGQPSPTRKIVPYVRPDVLPAGLAEKKEGRWVALSDRRLRELGSAIKVGVREGRAVTPLEAVWGDNVLRLFDGDRLVVRITYQTLAVEDANQAIADIPLPDLMSVEDFVKA